METEEERHLAGLALTHSGEAGPSSARPRGDPGDPALPGPVPSLKSASMALSSFVSLARLYPKERF